MNSISATILGHQNSLETIFHGWVTVTMPSIGDIMQRLQNSVPDRLHVWNYLCGAFKVQATKESQLE